MMWFIQTYKLSTESSKAGMAYSTSQFELATFQVMESRMWPEVPTLDSTAVDKPD